MSEDKKNCGLARDLMPLSLDGICSESSQRFLDDHLKSCDKCRAAFNKMSGAESVVPPQPEPASEEQKALASSVKKTARRMKIRRWLIILLIPVLLITGIFTAHRINDYRMNIEKPLPLANYDISLQRSNHYVALDLNVYNAPGAYATTHFNYEIITAQTENGLKRAAVLTLIPTYCPNRPFNHAQGRIATYSLNGSFTSMLYAEDTLLYTINNEGYYYKNADEGDPFELHLTLGMPVCQIRIADETETKVIYTWGDPLQELADDSLHFSGSFHTASTNDIDCINTAILWNTEVFLTDAERDAFSIPEVSPIAFKNRNNNAPLPTAVPMRKDQTVVSTVNTPEPDAQENGEDLAPENIQESTIETIVPENTDPAQSTPISTDMPESVEITENE